MADTPCVALRLKAFAPPFLHGRGMTAFGLHLDIEAVVAAARYRQAQIRHAGLHALLLQVLCLNLIAGTSVGYVMEQGQLRPLPADRWLLAPLDDGVTYYNDSIGTSPTRTIAGLRSFDQKVILIAGGYDKHIPYEPLAPEITAHVKNLVLMGATGPRIEKAVREDPNFNEVELPIQHADNMQHAVELARACAKPGDIIILSPASASFDLYPNFEVRGREFKSIVNTLK